MGAIGNLCLLVLVLALIHGCAHSICPRAQAALLPPTSEPEARELLNLIREYKFDSEVEKVLASSSAKRRLKQDPGSGSSPTTFPPASGETVSSAHVADVQPPSREAHPDYVFEGY
eukprot:TRINITY_DN22499_c0_g1_i1.p1 TRINITY_DN22499_c0_g1~~TRINITY_DN22499_c0_g1_i1.p1  ORF type:complete len:116 (-),score=12.35 TRINITY_DN22499_c0_g1_i1:164-511(-)